MGHTYSKLLFHVIFSTKNRSNFLYKNMRKELYKYLCGIAKNEGVRIIRVNGVEDHIHLLLNTSTSIAPANIIRTLKSNSCGWIHKRFPQMQEFSWQNGYGIFSVSESAKNKVINYINNQERHHAHISFEEELKIILIKHGVEFDPQHYLD